MPSTAKPTMSWDQACKVLGVSGDADAQQIRLAYLDQVRQHPPETDPEQFERVRDAHDLLKDPRVRARRVLMPEPDITAPLTDLLGTAGPARPFVGPGPWLDVLMEKRP